MRDGYVMFRPVPRLTRIKLEGVYIGVRAVRVTPVFIIPPHMGGCGGEFPPHFGAEDPPPPPHFYKGTPC